ncbi:AraC family transcriptional regulator [Terribacillus saccharophilus]|uniref:helix-turn-helix domain-containing protein n=1 Tax=Terribacillus saccharophilus TaxID=361277 RepID=UPI003982A416
MQIPFKPTQPEMSMNSSSYHEMQTNQMSETGVSLFYQFKTAHEEITSLPVIPDGCIDILFNLSSAAPSVMVAASPTQRRLEVFESNTEYFCVRLTADQHILKFTCTIKELIQHKVLPLEDACSPGLVSFDELHSLSSLSDRAAWFLAAFESTDNPFGNHDNLIRYCIHQIHSSKGLISVNQLAELTGYSDRYVRKKFEEYIGFSPKQFCQIVRLQYTIHLLMNEQYAFKEILDQQIFYDKAHVYKEFKKYMSMTPMQYSKLLQDINGTTIAVH